MVTGFYIFIHSVQIILRNRADVFRLAALPLVVVLGALFALGTLGSAAKSGGMPNPGAALVFLPLLFIAGACALWFIVNWHRFILLEEYPQGWIPKFRGDRVLSYLGYSLLLVIVMLCGLVPVLIVQLVVLQSGNFEILAAVMVGMMFIISILFTRLSLILPAAAINKPLKISEAFSATRGSLGPIVVVTLLMFMASFTVSFVASLFAVTSTQLLVELVVLPLHVFLAVLQVSILTTLYGHYVEGRPVTG